MPAGKVVIQARCVELSPIHSRRLKREVITVVVAVGCDPVAQAAGLRSCKFQVFIHDSLDRRIACRRVLPDIGGQSRILGVNSQGIC